MSPVMPRDLHYAKPKADASLQRFVRAAQPGPGSVSVRRRGSIKQGQALETLGHAVEYLVDSRLFQLEAVNQRDEQEAIQILMRMSRAVFEECPEVIPLRKKVRRWFAEHIARSSDWTQQ